MNFFKQNIILLLILAFGLFITYDIIITNILNAYYCSQEPNPKTHIAKKVEYPESIYWEDNVYPGFSKEDRELMIVNYLDGVHLKTMALNGDDGKVYVYEAKEGDFDSFTYDKKFKDRYKQYTHIIMQNEKVYTKETMPKLNYNVTFKEIKLNNFANKFLYSDETKIVENNTSNVIAYNRQIMRFYYKLQPDFAGGRYYSKVMCGGKKFIPYQVFGYVEETPEGEIKLTDRVRNTGIHNLSRNKKLYKKYIKGEK